MTSARRPSIAPARMTLAVASLLAVVLSLVMVAATAAATHRTYYVSCHGSDAASGRSTAAAWRTLAKASAARLHPGDRLRLERGCSFAGGLRASWEGTASRPITIDAYGTGGRPRVEGAVENFDVTGRYLVFTDMWTSSPPTSHDSQCENTPLGNTFGWRLHPGSDHVTIKRSKAKGLQFGVWIENGSDHNRVLRNDFLDINVLDPNTDSGAGAVAIAIHGDDNEVAWNHIQGSDACSRLYDRDGAAVDIYGGQRNRIHQNFAVDNNAFVEIGKSLGDNKLGRDTTIDYNEVRSSLTIANFLVVRGGDDRYGPTPGTNVRHNSVYLTGSQSYAVQCNRGCTPEVLDFRDNIVWAQYLLFNVQGSWGEARNIWFIPGGSLENRSIDDSSRFAEPRFVDPTRGDLRLRPSSPAVDAGGAPPSLSGGPRDLANIEVPQGKAPDIGAWERPR
jgi:hypothetical protein